eukprot:s379_g10.t1
MASPAINHAQSECGAEIRAVTVLEVDKASTTSLTQPEPQLWTPVRSRLSVVSWRYQSWLQVAGFFVRILFVRSIRWLMIEGLESMATRPCPSGSPCSSLREMALKS